MGNYVELTRSDLDLNFNIPDFNTSMEIPPYTKLIGQAQAERSIDIGLSLTKKGYNIFITGHSGTGKTGYLISKVEEYASHLPTPPDWCYVYNFIDPLKPRALQFSPGSASEFKESINELIQMLMKEATSTYEDKAFEAERNEIISKYEKLILKDNEKLENSAMDLNFIVKQSEEDGFLFIPMKEDGQEMDSKAYTALDELNRDLISESANILRMLSIEVVKDTQSLERQMEAELEALTARIANGLLADQFSMLKSRFGESTLAIEYLEEMKADIIKNIDYFIQEGQQEENRNADLMKLFFDRYDVNIIVDHKMHQGAPVIFEDSPEYTNLFGKIEYENKGGNISTSYQMIRPGSLHIGNNGYIIVNAYQLLASLGSWQSLKRCLRSQQITIESSKESMELYPVVTLKPENIPFMAKLILIGDEYTYSMLSTGDPDFNKLFKIKSEFDDIFEINGTNTEMLLGFISDYNIKNQLKPLTADGAKALLRHSSRIAESSRHYTAYLSKLGEVLDFANMLASTEGSPLITDLHIVDGISELDKMHNHIKNKLLDMYRSRKYITELRGSRIGQVNGLSVVDYGDCIIGQQHRITAVTYAGRDGIVDIEREADLSGSIHSKGILILSGYIGQFIGQDIPLSFNASIVFEQLYSGIEGDSASAAELIALLSSLSDIPVRQALAITGSVNQFGEIQPIGGVIHKIEGYFDICKALGNGLSGTQGVIIPDTNIDELVLRLEVLDAIDDGLFHIYTAKTIEDCLELLFDRSSVEGEPYSLLEATRKRIIDKLTGYNQVLSKATSR